MDAHCTTASALYASLGTAAAPVIVDVRRGPAFEADGAMVAGALRRPPEEVGAWAASLPPGRAVVAYCVHGHEVSQGVVRALRSAGVAATFLEGGIEGWRERGLLVRRRDRGGVRRWVTREHPKIDRIACPWLIRRFIEPGAEFVYVPADRVFALAAETGAVPYDIPGAEPLAHDGELCSFDAFLAHYGLRDPALDRLAPIVRGADTARHDLAPQAAGLHAISLGLSANSPDDHAMLEQGMVIYDALYTWCRDLTDEVHNWTPAAAAPASAPVGAP